MELCALPTRFDDTQDTFAEAVAAMVMVAMGGFAKQMWDIHQGLPADTSIS